MICLTTEGAMKYKIHMAKQALIKARIARQLGTIEQETSMYFGDNSTPEERAQVLLDEAKALRKDAQD